MRLKGIIVFIVLLSLWGCSNTLTGPQTPIISAANTYFWPDSDATYTYVSDADGHTHNIIVKKGKGVTDRDITDGDSNTSLKVSVSQGVTTLSGLTTNDIFSLNRDLLVVADLTPDPNYSPAAVNSIVTMNSSMYVLTDTAVYQYSSIGDSLHWFSSWWPALKNFRLYQDPNSSRFYAAEIGGTKVYYYSSNAKSWLLLFSSSAPIDIFAAGDKNDPGAQCWFSSDKQLYRFDGSNPVAVGPPLFQKITAIEHSGNKNTALTLIGLSDGSVFTVDKNDQKQQIESPSGFPITSISSGFVGSQNGIYSYRFGNRLPFSSDPARLIYAASGIQNQWYMYNAMPDNTVTSSDGQTTISYGKPLQGQISQLASDYIARIYALIGTKVYSYRDSAWVWLARTLPRTAQWLPGGLHLLQDNDSSWVAGYMENLTSKIDRGYAYIAKMILKSSQVDLDGIRYYDVIAIRYTANANGVEDRTSMPEYTIYYERGLGPVRIEKVQAGVKQTTRIVLP